MQYFPPALEKLVEQFARLPGVGRKSAQRMAFFVLSLPEDEAAAFADAIVSAKRAIRCCPVCQNLTDSDGSISVSYAAFDSAGNVAKAKREGRYTDYERPRFTLNAPLVYTVDHSFDVLSNVGAVDAIDGDIQHRVRATTKGTSSIMALGSHMVQFQVTNSLGDTVSETFPVEVISSGIYNAALELTDYLVYLPKDAQFYPAQYLKSFTWLGEQDSLAGGLPTDYSMRTRGTVQTGYPGVYTVEYRVTFTDRDEKNPDFDRKYTGYSKLIVVVEG